MKICLCQLNPTVGDLRGNVKKTLSTVNDAYKGGANLIVYPEMFLSGYQCRSMSVILHILYTFLAGLIRIKNG